MKKMFIFILFLMFTSTISAKELEVKFSKCVDGDTAKFIYNDKEITARFLAIDTPETVHPTKEEEAFGKDASEYTCNKIKNANKIILEYDSDSDKTDKYDRHLVWVFVDDNLLQEKLVRKGLASVAYLYGDYKYTNILEEAELEAENNKIGIWSINDDSTIIIETAEEIGNNQKDGTQEINNFIENNKEYIILIGSLILVCIFNLKSKKRIKTKLQKKIIKNIKKKLK